ncbi:MAG: hypothetical protein CFE37_04055 [Alphaproteobacteria bacterium PA4]|nr:MAG: hypothetical protein CFE37_04055 [Alphaproteobacteria bacterium PA4]
MLPPSTNAAYAGHPAAAWFVMLTGVLSIIPGCIHFFLPDGGAGVIAGIDLSTRATTIIAVFAWLGALQIPHGILQFVIGWHYRPLVPLVLALVIVERGLMAFDGWFGKASLTGHHPPEHYASVAAVALAALFLFLSQPRRVAG